MQYYYKNIPVTFLGDRVEGGVRIAVIKLPNAFSACGVLFSDLSTSLNSEEVPGYNPTLDNLCKRLINLVFPEDSREDVGNVDTIYNKIEQEMAQLTEYRRMHETANPLEDQVNEDCAPRTQVRIDFLKDLDLVTQQVFDMLSEKNLKYGDSALNPSGIFAKCDPIELINVRIDDKLARIKNGAANEDEDPEWDLIGYLFLKRIAKMRQGRNNGH